MVEFEKQVLKSNYSQSSHYREGSKDKFDYPDDEIKFQATSIPVDQGAGGTGAGVSTYSTMYQFGFDGDWVFKFPK